MLQSIPKKYREMIGQVALISTSPNLLMPLNAS